MCKINYEAEYVSNEIRISILERLLDSLDLKIFLLYIFYCSARRIINPCENIMTTIIFSVTHARIRLHDRSLLTGGIIDCSLLTGSSK